MTRTNPWTPINNRWKNGPSHQRHVDKQNRDFAIAIAALVISIAAAGFTGLQWLEARQTRIDDEKHFDIARQDAAKAAGDQQAQVERSAASADRSAEASEKSTDIAGESLRLNRQIFQTSERAFVHAKEITIAVELDKPAKAVVRFENAGRTTAKDARMRVSITILSTPPTTPPPDAPLGAPIIPRDLVGGETTDLIVATNDPISKDLLELLKNGGAHIYVYGHAEYKDTFAHPHKTTFCAMYNKDDPSRSPACPFLNTID